MSICVPTFNGALFLDETIACIEAQTMRDYEVVIMDDLSTDRTLAIAEAYAARDARVRVIHNTERAGTSARNANRCLAHARGEWVKFLFQDDLMAPTCLEQMLVAGTRGRLVISWHDYLYTGDVDAGTRAYYESLSTLRSEFPPAGATADQFSDAMLRHWYANFIGPTSSSCIHRSCFDDYGAFSAHIRSFPDLDFWIRVGNVEGIAIVPDHLVTFRVHETSISSAMRRAAWTFRQDLDELQLALDLARSPGHANIRGHAQRRGFDPEANLFTCARGARWVAEDALYRERNAQPMAEWEAFCERNPAMRDVLASIDASLPLAARVRRHLKRILTRS